MERVGHPQRPHPHAAGPEPLRDLPHRARVTGNYDRGRAVHRRDRHARHALDRLGDFGFGGRDRGHRPAAREGLHQPGPRRHQTARIRQRQHPRRIRGSDLADRMTRYRIGSDAARGEQRHQAGADREQPGLGEHGLVRPFVISLAQHHLGDRHPQLGLQPGTRPVERRREHRRGGVQLPAHPGPLRALAGEQEPHPGTTAGRGHAGDHPGGRCTGRQRGQAGGQLFAVRAQDHGPVFQRRPGGRQRPPHVYRVEVGVRGHVGRQPARLRGQARRGPGRHQPRHRSTGQHGGQHRR